MRSARLAVAATWILLGMLAGTGSAVATTEAYPQRIRIEYGKPENPSLQPLYDMMHAKASRTPGIGRRY
jgi:hypothetical protein